jgi:hypothetical protein
MLVVELNVIGWQRLYIYGRWMDVCGLGLCWGSMNAGLEVGSGDRIKSEQKK